jgi:SAM-dependent methyltransferase
MGAYLQITPVLAQKLGYGQVRGCYLGPTGRTDHKRVVSSRGDIFECSIDLFDAERDAFPYPDASFDTVICGELVEHLSADPMHMMGEINRVLKPGGHLVLTTPNAASARAIASVMDSYHPGFFTTYIRPHADGTPGDPRHCREYTAKEAYRLAVDAGFDVERIETGEFSEGADAQYGWVGQLLAERGYEAAYRGDGTYILARKVGPVRDRWPNWLYS